MSPLETRAVPLVVPADIELMFYPSALIFAVNACNSASSCSFVDAGAGVELACCANTAASCASLSASSSAVNGIGPSAVM